MRTPKPRTLAGGEVVWTVRYRREGRQRTLTVHGPNAEAQATEFAKLLDLVGVDRAVAWWNSQLETAGHTNTTLDDYAPRYLERLTRITAGTRIGYERMYRRVWSPSLGSLPVSAISEELVARAINDQVRAGKSDKTIRNAHGLLAAMMKAAVRDKLTDSSPCEHIALPRHSEHRRVEMRFLTHDEWDQLLDALPAHYRPLFTFLVGTGARWGEAEALEVGDVDLESGVVRITKAVKWDASKSTRDVGPPKTKKSRRTVTLPRPVVDALAPLVEGRPKSQRLFLAPRGGPLRHRTAYDEWKAAVERAGLDPQPRIHDLRHTHVAWLIAQGVPLPVIQARLGHESITTTIDRYGHLLPDLQLAAARAAEVAMLRATSRPPELSAGG